VKLDVDHIIDLIDQITETPKEEMGEQEVGGGGGATSSPSGGGKGYPAVTKWETGIVRGVANPVKLGKWKDLYTTQRGKANTLL
jgi:hypothetical protein